MKKQGTIYNITLSAVMVALGTALSFVKVWEMPLGGSVTLLSMLPIVMVSCMLGVKWGLASAFVYAAIQLFVDLGKVLSWGLTPAMLIGTLLFDYIIAFTVLGLAGLFVKKGYGGVLGGTALAVALRFVSHFISGYVIFRNLEQFSIFGNIFTNKPFLYSVAYNGFYMLPELILTLIGTAILFKNKKIRSIAFGG